MIPFGRKIMIRMKMMPSTIWLAPNSGGTAKRAEVKPRSRCAALAQERDHDDADQRAGQAPMPPSTSMLIRLMVRRNRRSFGENEPR